MGEALTEAAVLQLLRARHTRTGNGGSGEYAFLTHVRNGAGFDANRTFDAITVNLWPSRGLTINVYEVKVSRNDWQRELKKPDKAEDACKVGDTFTIVAPAGCVKDGELPPSWGLLEVTGDGDTKPWKLREKVPARMLRPDEAANRKNGQVSRALLVGMLRSCPGAIPGGKVPAPDQAELNAMFEKGKAEGLASAERMRPYRERELARLHDDVQKFKAALVAEGIDSWAAELAHLADRAPAIADALRGAKVDDRLEHVRNALTAALSALDPVATRKDGGHERPTI